MTTYVYREDSGYDETFEAVSDEAAEAYSDPLEAAAWTYGLTRDQYARTVRRT